MITAPISVRIKSQIVKVLACSKWEIIAEVARRGVGFDNWLLDWRQDWWLQLHSLLGVWLMVFLYQKVPSLLKTFRSYYFNRVRHQSISTVLELYFESHETFISVKLFVVSNVMIPNTMYLMKFWISSLHCKISVFLLFVMEDRYGRNWRCYQCMLKRQLLKSDKAAFMSRAIRKRKARWMIGSP